jgi:hypothetical protein
MRYFDSKCSKANVTALRTFQDFTFKPDEDDLTLVGQVHDHYRDEYGFLAKLNFTVLEKLEMHQIFLDLDGMPNVHLKDAVQLLCEKLEGRYKGQFSEDLLQDFRDKLEEVVEDFRLKGTRHLRHPGSYRESTRLPTTAAPTRHRHLRATSL